MKGFVVAIVIILLLGFCVFCYHTRNNYNVDNLDRQVIYLRYENRVLSYALSIVPKDVKNEVFSNSVKEKFPGFEEDDSLREIIGIEKKKEDDVAESEVEKKTQTVVGAMNEIVSDITD